MKFEEHEGQLFRMLEEPVPLTENTQFPCLVRMIQDETQMGKYNNDMNCLDIIKDMLWITRNIKENPLYSNTLHAYEKDSNGQDSCIASIHQLEIIGYPVAEGSAEWALYQMMQGYKVTKGHLEHTYWHYDARPHLQCISEYNCGTLQIRVVPEIWLTTAEPTGWQIYKEPEYPKPKYQVGDWVEVYGKQHLITGRPYIEDNDWLMNNVYGNQEKYHEIDITRKLSPSEVVIHIGCLSGTVVHSVSEDCFLLARVNDPQHRACCIDMSMLDTETRSLVESLLKAQEEEC